MAPRNPALRAAEVLHFCATRPVFTAASALCYLAAVGYLVYAIALQARLESWVTRVAMTAIDPAPISPTAAESTPCANVSGMERGICKAEVRLEIKRSKLKQRAAARKVRVAPIAIEPAAIAPDPAVLTLFENGSVLEWASPVATSAVDGERIRKSPQALAAIR